MTVPLDRTCATSPPRRFRFGLRTLFVVFVIVAIPCAWAGYSLNWIRQRHEFLRDIMPEPSESSAGPRRPVPYGTASAPAGLWLFGEQGYEGMYVYIYESERATRLFPEAKIEDLAELLPLDFGRGRQSTEERLGQPIVCPRCGSSNLERITTSVVEMGDDGKPSLPAVETSIIRCRCGMEFSDPTDVR